MLSYLDGNYFKNMIICGANNLELSRQAVNRLNVFPVPDGDTGTNMCMTMAVAVNEIRAETSDDISHIANKTASALLRGARGNSGVILSLMFRGIYQGLKGLDKADCAAMADAFKKGVDAAYKAVMKPTEGTILTVARISAQHIVDNSSRCESMVELFEALVSKADEVLQQTPQMLPVLKQANVVDAGGMGLLLIYRGMLHYLKTGTMIEADIQGETFEEADFPQISDEDIKFTYCTEFLVIKDRTKAALPIELQKFLDEIGDSIVVVDDDELIKVHVHTNNPGSVLERALTMGSLSKIKIENMKEQHTQQTVLVPMSLEPQKPYGFVVTCAGSGMAEIFKDLGADHIVEGGQTMNPSTEDIIKAIERTNSEVVFVLPNNKNIIMASQQAQKLCNGKKVIVIPSKTIPQGIGAMLGFDESLSAEENTANMEEAMGLVKTGSVTYADRDSVYFEREIKEGQFLALSEGNLVDVSGNRIETTVKLIEELCRNKEELVTIYYGENVDKDETDALAEACRERLGSDVEVNVIYGGQPVYYYIISAE